MYLSFACMCVCTYINNTCFSVLKKVYWMISNKKKRYLRFLLNLLLISFNNCFGTSVTLEISMKRIKCIEISPHTHFIRFR